MNASSSSLPVYVLAVSGGIDSMVLADICLADASKHYVIAHFDHGIRHESHNDEEFVRGYAIKRQIPYVSERAELGEGAGEDKARRMRYDFLRQVQKDYGAIAIVTAHHQDDVIETICINLIRGTGWRGLVSLRSRAGLIRPLISMTKADIIQYALEHDIEWVEDATNEDARYLRNNIRQTVMRQMTGEQRQAFVRLYERQLECALQIEQEMQEIEKGARTGRGLSRYYLTMLPPEVAKELLQRLVGDSLERAQCERLLLFVKTAQPGKIMTVAKKIVVGVTNDELFVYPPET